MQAGESWGLVPPQGWGEAALEVLGIAPWRIPFVVVSAVAVYLFLVLALRLFGARLLSGLSTFDTVVAIMLGAVAGRVILGHPPTLAAGLIGLGTLVLLEVVFGALARTARGRRVVAGSPRVLVAHGEVLEAQLRRGHVSRADLASALRRAGLTTAREAACVVLEANGALSVIRAGDPLDPALLAGVRGADAVLRSADGGAGAGARSPGAGARSPGAGTHSPGDGA